LDPFSNYLAPEEYAKYKLSQQSHYAGVGMEIEKNQTGQTVCTPYPEGPAARAGIEPGDILEAVDDIGTVGESILSLAAKIRGQQGTEVRLSVLNRSGQRKHVRISRAALQSRSVFIERPRGAVPIIRVLAFTNGTPRELKEAVDTLSGSSTVVIDLRGNPGGSLYSAIDAATLFLARGQKIAGVQTQKGLKEYRSDFSAAYPSPRLYLWQDEHTASAAEVFIAALCENQRAASIGRKTAGKGTIQEILALSDGSALYLTTGRLQTPSGTAYHGVGLAPSYPLAAAPAKTEDYRLKVKALMGE
jgi:carboxyl-terminal processing protease